MSLRAILIRRLHSIVVVKWTVQDQSYHFETHGFTVCSAFTLCFVLPFFHSKTYESLKGDKTMYNIATDHNEKRTTKVVGDNHLLIGSSS